MVASGQVCWWLSRKLVRGFMIRLVDVRWIFMKKGKEEEEEVAALESLDGVRLLDGTFLSQSNHFYCILN